MRLRLDCVHCGKWLGYTTSIREVVRLFVSHWIHHCPTNPMKGD